MARKNHNPGCPCCDSFPCTPTDCGDETTSPIRRVTLELVMPDEIVAINPSESGTGRRMTHISSGWESLNGTYTFELNLTTCVWQSIKIPDASGIYAEAWLLPSTANCSNYLSLIDPSIMIPALEPQFLAADGGVNIEMVTTNSGTVFTHTFLIRIPGAGPFFSWNIEADETLGVLCDESPLVFREIRLGTSTSGQETAQFVCDGDDALTSTANSYVT